LKGSSINVNKKGNRLQILPLTDKDVMKMSNGELKDPGAMLQGKNLATRKGGLFDSAITGGIKGTQWSHINLTNKLCRLVKNRFDKIKINKVINACLAGAWSP